MQSKQFTAALALLAAPALSFAQSQEVPTAPKARAGQNADQEQKTPHFAAVSKLIGMDVLARGTSNGERTDVADIHDFVVDGASGVVTQVILSSGGVGSVGDTLRMRPFADLRFDRTDPKAPKIWLDLTEADFDDSAEMTEDALDAYGSKAIAAAHLGDKATVREAGANKQSNDAKIAGTHMSMLMLASELDDFDVRAMVGSDDVDNASKTGASKTGASKTGALKTGESIGTMDEAWVDCSTGKVAYVTLQHNKRLVVLPMAALVTIADTEQKALVCQTRCSVAQLAAAPAIDEKANLTLDNADFRKSVTEYYARLASNPVGESAGRTDRK